MALNGRSYDRGVGVHANCLLTYELQRAFERFTARVGIDDAAGADGDAIVRVVGDGHVLFERRVRSGQRPFLVSVSVQDVERLELDAIAGKAGDIQDWVDWADAALVKAPGAPASSTAD
jgi:hypothetical protein